MHACDCKFKGRFDGRRKSKSLKWLNVALPKYHSHQFECTQISYTR